MAQYDPNDKHTFRHDLAPYENEGLNVGQPGRRFNNIYAKVATVDTLNYTTLNPPPSGAGFPLLANPVGNVGAPAYSYLGDTNTGIFRSAVGTVAFAASGSQIATVDTSGLTVSNNLNITVSGATGKLEAGGSIVLGNGNKVTITKSTSIARAVIFGDAAGTVFLLDGGQTVTSGIWQGTLIDTTRGGWGQSMAAASGVPTWNAGALTLNAITSGAYWKGAAGNGVTFQATPIPSADGGLGVNSPTAHGIMVAEGASAVALKVLTDGQLLIGSTGNDPVGATLTAGTNIGISSAPGSITINSTAVGVSVFSQSGAVVTINNSAAETTLVSVSITGGTLGTAHKLRVKLYGRASGAANLLTVTDSFTVRCKYGATTLVTGTALPCHLDDGASQANLANEPWMFEFELCAANATGAQTGWYGADLRERGTYSVSSVIGLYPHYLSVTSNLLQRGTAAEDSTLAKTLALTGQFSAARSGLRFDLDYYSIEVV